MTYHRGNAGLGDVDGTYKNYGHGDATFRVSNLDGTSAESAKALAKILAMVKAVPGIVGSDAAWGAGGVITANFRAAEGTPVNGTAATIRRNAANVGAQIRSGVTVTVTRTGYTPADVTRDAPVAEQATPTELAPSSPLPAAESSIPIWPFVAGASVLVLGLGAFFVFRKKPAQVAAGAV